MAVTSSFGNALKIPVGVVKNRWMAVEHPRKAVAKLKSKKIRTAKKLAGQ